MALLEDALPSITINPLSLNASVFDLLDVHLGTEEQQLPQNSETVNVNVDPGLVLAPVQDVQALVLDENLIQSEGPPSETIEILYPWIRQFWI